MFEISVYIPLFQDLPIQDQIQGRTLSQKRCHHQLGSWGSGVDGPSSAPRCPTEIFMISADSFFRSMVVSYDTFLLESYPLWRFAKEKILNDKTQIDFQERWNAKKRVKQCKMCKNDITTTNCKKRLPVRTNRKMLPRTTIFFKKKTGRHNENVHDIMITVCEKRKWRVWKDNSKFSLEKIDQEDFGEICVFNFCLNIRDLLVYSHNQVGKLETCVLFCLISVTSTQRRGPAAPSSAVSSLQNWEMCSWGEIDHDDEIRLIMTKVYRSRW